jgi:hypothetical protein
LGVLSPNFTTQQKIPLEKILKENFPSKLHKAFRTFPVSTCHIFKVRSFIVNQLDISVLTSLIIYFKKLFVYQLHNPTKNSISEIVKEYFLSKLHKAYAIFPVTTCQIFKVRRLIVKPLEIVLRI